MAKFTIEDLYCGDKYGIMGEVIKEIFAHQEEFANGPNQFRELEIVGQTHAKTKDECETALAQMIAQKKQEIAKAKEG